ncbi:hydrolase [Peniophora sp. CONT]|nr:hydrolase [Peniophora sp. CONT]
MGKKKSGPPEEALLLPAPPFTTGSAPIVDTHTHLVSTFGAYRQKYKDGRFDTIYDFVRGIYATREGRPRVESIVDVWCEAPVQRVWKEIADSALDDTSRKENWAGIDYWFVMGVHPHEAKVYDDAVEKDILEAMAHPRCVGWGEIGLDYHYDNSPRELQQQVLVRQLRNAVRLGKPLTIHTREADEDIERILKAEVPKEHKIHIHCFTDAPELAQRLLDHFPNLFIGITGVITYSSNLNTVALVRQLAQKTEPPRIILETDAPYMVPSNLYDALPGLKGRLPLCHTAMIPWTAQFVADAIGGDWDAGKVMELGRANARTMYGV